jgi:ankyrin repeat protein
VEAIQILKGLDIDMNHQNENCNTPLTLAAIRGHTAVIVALFQTEQEDKSHPIDAGLHPRGSSYSGLARRFAIGRVPPID